MISISEDIERTITGYGYLLVKPKKIFPSYYRIVGDKTFIEALIRIETVVEDAEKAMGYAVYTSNNVKAYVSKEKRKPELFEAIQQVI